MAKFKQIALFSVLSLGMTLNSLAMYDYIGSFFGRETDEEIRTKIEAILKENSDIQHYWTDELEKQQQEIIEEIKQSLKCYEDFERQLQTILHGDVVVTSEYTQSEHDQSLPAEILDYVKERMKSHCIDPKSKSIVSNYSLIEPGRALFTRLFLSKIWLKLFNQAENQALINHEIVHMQRADYILCAFLDEFITEKKCKCPSINTLLQRLWRSQEVIADQSPAVESIEHAQALKSGAIKGIIASIVIPYWGWRQLLGLDEHPSTMRRYLDACRIIRYLEIEKQLRTDQIKNL